MTILYQLAMTTFPSLEVAESIVGVLLERKIIACANLLPEVSSMYFWEGKICQDNEVLVLMKTTSLKFLELKSVIEKNHPYDVPEVIALDITQGSEDYLSWLAKVVHPEMS